MNEKEKEICDFILGRMLNGSYSISNSELKSATKAYKNFLQCIQLRKSIEQKPFNMVTQFDQPNPNNPK